MDTSPYRDDVRREMAARTHRDIDGNPKKAGARNGVTARTGRRWRTPDDAKGSPNYRLQLYAETCPNPYRLIASIEAVADERLRKMTDQELIDRVRDLVVQSSANMIDRALACERDAASDLELARLYRECAVRRIGWNRITHG